MEVRMRKEMVTERRRCRQQCVDPCTGGQRSKQLTHNDPGRDGAVHGSQVSLQPGVLLGHHGQAMGCEPEVDFAGDHDNVHGAHVEGVPHGVHGCGRRSGAHVDIERHGSDGCSNLLLGSLRGSSSRCGRSGAGGGRWGRHDGRLQRHIVEAANVLQEIVVRLVVTCKQKAWTHA